MNGYVTMAFPKARKEHLCEYCYGPILVGEFHAQASGHSDGEAFRYRLHEECRSVLQACWEDYQDDGFTPGEGSMPDRVRAIVESRKSEAANV